jgi:hypothetical protein
MEAGIRAVEVDDLMWLAVALNVPPTTLLMPVAEAPADSVELGPHRVLASDAWAWAVGDVPYETSEQTDDAESDVAFFRNMARPWWLRLQTDVPLYSMQDEAREQLLAYHRQAESSRGPSLQKSIKSMEQREQRGDKSLKELDDYLREERDRLQREELDHG